jgi:hypothetical protein
MSGRHASPRWGRISAALSAVLVTLVAVLGAIGLMPAGASSAASRAGTRVSLSSHAIAADAVPAAGDALSSDRPTPTPTSTSAAADTAVPAVSGTGRRVVFDMSDQRVWLVDADGKAERSYLVSGSLTDNLHPGSYAVYSKSRYAVGVDDSGVMQYFVRFTRGANAAIGFHSIPTKNGKALQTRAELGSPESHGCIRQWLPDAKALWTFAPVGTKVVVTA